MFYFAGGRTQGDGNFHALIMFDRHKPEQVAEAERLSSFMVHKALEMEGTCTGEHGVGTGKIKYLPGELQLQLLFWLLLLLVVASARSHKARA